MARYASTIVTDEGMPGIPLGGVLVTVIASSGQLAPITDDTGLAMANPITLGSLGVLEFNIPDPGDTLLLQYRYGGRLLREDSVIVGKPAAFQGNPGVGGNTFTSLSTLKALNPANYASSILADGVNPPINYAYVAGDFTGVDDEVNIVKLNSVAINVGALVRQSAQSLTFQQAGASTVRSLRDKTRELAISITDYGATTGSDIVASVNAALTALGTTNAATLTIPKGAWVIGSPVDWSPYRNVTFDIQPGAVIANAANTVVLPERVKTGLGASFTGTGAVTQKNTNQASLQSPPSGHIVSGNAARGVGALGAIVGGYSNFAEGVNALGKAQYVRSSIAWGNGALAAVIGDATGTRAYGTYYALADSNIAIGDGTLQHTTTGYENLALGTGTLVQNTTGFWNLAIGHQSLIQNQTGSSNTALGSYTLTVYGGNNSMAIGWAALEVLATGSNHAVGYVSQNACTTGSLNTSLGAQTLQFNTTGGMNTAVGQEVLKNLQTGSNNTGVGSYALGAVATASTNNTAVGTNALVAGTNLNGCTAVGSGAGGTIDNVTNSTAIGLSAQIDKSNQVVLGNASVVETLVRGVVRANTTYAVGGLPSASAAGAGARTFVTDASAATFGTVVAGGGANNVPVYSTGADWRIG